jgi:hypothetical protein
MNIDKLVSSIENIEKNIKNTNDKLQKALFEYVMVLKLQELHKLQKLQKQQELQKQQKINTLRKKKIHKNDKVTKKNLPQNERELRSMIEKDNSNNRLMDRVNSELHFRKNGYEKKTVIKPYDGDKDHHNHNDNDNDDDDDGDSESDLSEGDKYVKTNKFKKHSIDSSSFNSRDHHGFSRNRKR